MVFSWKQALREKTVWYSLVVVASLGLLAVLAPWIAPHDPYRLGVTSLRLPPMWVQNTSPAGMAEYPLGTDQSGRDVLSRLIYGTRTAFFLAFLAVPLAALIGVLVGLITGYIGGRLDAWMMFITDIVQSLPGILFMVIIILIFRGLLSATFFNGLITLVIGFAAISWVSLARLIRVQVLILKSQLFVEAAISLGASPGSIILHHLLPNVLHAIVVWIINNIPAVILLEAMLGYIGIGVTSASADNAFTVISWGGMFYAGRSALSRNPLMLVLPSLGILLISTSFILLGDYLKSATGRK